MKKIILIISVIFFAAFSTIQAQTAKERQLTIQMAVKYYNEKNYERAAPLLKEVLNRTSSSHYFRLFITSLVELKEFDKAEDEIKSEIRKKRFQKSDLLVNWGYLYKIQEMDEEAEKKYKEAIKEIGNSKSNYVSTANLFIQWQEYEYAKELYLKGRQKLPEEDFSSELARVYYYMRDFENMMAEYLTVLETDEKRLPVVQSTVNAALRLDVDDEMKLLFREMILLRIQEHPNLLVYNRLLIWLMLQEKNFSGALRQTIALDQRTGNEEDRIANLANIALNSRDYEIARRAFEYLMNKGEDNPYYLQSYIQNILVSYLIFQESGYKDLEKGKELAGKFKDALEFLGYLPETYAMLKEYAHLEAFYLKEPEKAIEVLKKGINIRGLRTEAVGELKTEMADIYVYSGDPWEATLIYSQVIEDNKKNQLGNIVKLKKAKLSYFLGNFEWAQAQLDVIKASTSKLTSNDAFELSLLISSNLDLDTITDPLQMFSRADFLFFRNEDSLALATLDSLENMYPYHTLVDDILYRKAKININSGNYDLAVASLEKIVSDFSYESLADDALFLLADTYQYRLNDTEKAQELYNKMLVDFPGSIFVVESRKRFRALRGDKVEEELPLPDREEFFFNGGIVP